MDGLKLGDAGSSTRTDYTNLFTHDRCKRFRLWSHAKSRQPDVIWNLEQVTDEISYQSKGDVGDYTESETLVQSPNRKCIRILSDKLYSSGIYQESGRYSLDSYVPFEKGKLHVGDSLQRKYYNPTHSRSPKCFSRCSFRHGRILPTEWSLNKTVFKAITLLWGTPMIDLF